MAKVIFKRLKGGLFPTDEAGWKILQKISQLGEVIVEIKFKRSVPNHRRFFKLRDTTFDMQDDYENEEQWRKVLQMYGGHYEEGIKTHQPCEKCGHSQTVVNYWPSSIAFDEMDEEAFSKLFRRAVDGFITRHQNTITDDQFMQIVNFD